jgi:hypothetical protein
MRVDICTTEDEDAKAALLAALAAVGVHYDAAGSFDSGECSLGVGLHRFRAPNGAALTVFMDAWGVDLDGPDDLMNRVLAVMTGKT